MTPIPDASNDSSGCVIAAAAAIAGAGLALALLFWIQRDRAKACDAALARVHSVSDSVRVLRSDDCLWINRERP